MMLRERTEREGGDGQRGRIGRGGGEGR